MGPSAVAGKIPMVMEMSQPSTATSDIELLPVREGYDRWATIYDQEDNPLIALEEPCVAEMLGEVRGLRIADIGCGTGRHALRLAQAGASVTAVDFSGVMLERAQRKPGAEAVRFVCHDLADPLPFEAAWFDRVLCCLVIEHVADLTAFFRELKRICQPAGFLVLSAMHPAMVLRGVEARFRDPDTGREVRPQSHGYQIADYVMAITQAGLGFTSIREYRVDADLAARSVRGRKYLGWPLLLTMQLGLPHSSGFADCGNARAVVVKC
jgi:malonyl-CoA O-methyltransferase